MSIGAKPGKLSKLNYDNFGFGWGKGMMRIEEKWGVKNEDLTPFFLF
ncbi:MAG: hypothetical protein KAQ85_02995 [Thermodesulfovibrionia bacterium]|nr:hypothetical protein [Thermodesulfovibrionia bacterium]